MKRCSKCGETKDVGEFYKQRSARDGLYPYCKVCAREAGRAWNRANFDRTAEAKRARYQANRESELEYRRVRWKANGEYWNARSRARRKSSPEFYKEKDRARYEANREVIIERRRAYYAATRGQFSSKGRARNGATRAVATHQGLVWTPSEDLIVMRPDVTAIEKAFMLGRSLSAVNNRARNLGKQERVSV